MNVGARKAGLSISNAANLEFSLSLLSLHRIVLKNILGVEILQAETPQT